MRAGSNCRDVLRRLNSVPNRVYSVLMVNPPHSRALSSALRPRLKVYWVGKGNFVCRDYGDSRRLGLGLYRLALKRLGRGCSALEG